MSGQFIFTINGNFQPLEAEAKEVEKKVQQTEKKVASVAERATSTIRQISAAISAVNSLLSIQRGLTKQTVDTQFLSLISAGVSLTASLATFQLAFAATGQIQLLPLVAAALAATNASVAFFRSEQVRNQQLLDQQMQTQVNRWDP